MEAKMKKKYCKKKYKKNPKNSKKYGSCSIYIREQI